MGTELPGEILEAILGEVLFEGGDDTAYPMEGKIGHQIVDAGHCTETDYLSLSVRRLLQLHRLFLNPVFQCFIGTGVVTADKGGLVRTATCMECDIVL